MKLMPHLRLMPMFRTCEASLPFLLYVFVLMQIYIVWAVLAEGVPSCGRPRPACAGGQGGEAEDC
jgi:hypothetical protein